MAQALVPLKVLADAKTRLAGLLSPGQRIALVEAMAEDVLEVLSSHPEMDRVVLISDDPEASALALRSGVECWPESGLGEPGLNGLVAAASARMLATGSSPLLVLHADLPLLVKEDIDAVLASLLCSGGLVVCCDQAGTGSNLLAFDAARTPQFCFGVDSCAGHVSWAQRSGVPVQIVRRLGCALDIDTADDLSALLAAAPPRPHGHTARLLRDSAIMAQIGRPGRSQILAAERVAKECADGSADSVQEGSEQ